MIKQLGGIFLFSENPKALAQWYQDHLGMEHDYTPDYEAFYISYPYSDVDDSQDRYTVWSIMKRKAGKPSDDVGRFTLNLRVDGLESMLERFTQKELPFEPMQVHPEGKFAWLHDLDGNRIELWEDVS